jgi:hypothetical protein
MLLFRINQEVYLDASGIWVLTAAPVGVANLDLSGNKAAVGVQIAIRVTAVTGAPSMVVKVQGVSQNGVRWDMIASAAITGVGTTVISLFPGATPTANVMANDHLPFSWSIVRTISGTGTVTGDIAAILLV